MEQYNDLLQKQKAFYHSGVTKPLAFRLEALHKLRDLVKSNEQELIAALKQDLNKSELEAYLSEIAIILEEIKFTLAHLKKWTKPRRVKTPLPLIGSKSYIYPEPYGVALIISPWNYPFQLAVAPLIGAIAAGNCAVLKPSELTPATSSLLARLIKQSFPEEYLAVVEGGVETSTALLDQKFDYIFFTGSVPVGKIIMQAAAKNLTPLTLELGGKSPCIVHSNARLDLAAKRIVWGKFLNAGQTCVAPDYLYVHQSVKQELLLLMEQYIKEFYGENPLENKEFTRIVSERHFHRLTSFLNNGSIVAGGRHSIETLTIEPTIMEDVSWADPVMADEIFGPILPVLEYTHLEQAIEEINQRPKPLALYVFTESSEIEQKVIQSIPYGGGCVNDTLFHLSSPYLPFGGVGESGIGAYHGKGSFDVFSHEKSILKQTTLFDFPIRYPNMKNGLKLLRKVFK